MKGGIPPTGKHVSFAGMSMSRFVDGKQAKHWSITDQFSLMQQLGVIL
ncbi:MAG: hypothetical protein GKR87_13060 [Kiritimatiellae bacterium]|nr:hypothetical protein [Kiritimatiellia bacterium]